MTNKFVAIKIMEWPIDKICADGTIMYQCDEDEICSCPDFLNDHNAAIMVVEKMREDGYLLRVLGLLPCHYECLFSSYDSETGQWYSHEEATSDSLCHTICEAALKAKGG